MAKDRAINSDHESEKFRKYLIEININSTPWYTIWFTDMTTESAQDKLLIDGASNVLVFSTIAKVKSYVQRSLHFLPDSKNFAGWIEHYRADIPYTVYYIEDVRRAIMKFESVAAWSKEDALDQIGIFNLIGDYRDLVNDSYLEEKMDSPIMSGFFDSAYNFHFWKRTDHLKDPELDKEEFKTAFTEIIDYFVKHIRFD